MNACTVIGSTECERDYNTIIILSGIRMWNKVTALY